MTVIADQPTHQHTKSSRYAWIIDKDHLFEDDDPPENNEAGVTGPSNAPDELLTRLTAGEGRAFRMFDDDGELYYSGRVIVRGRDGTAWRDVDGGEEDFGPLRDFGTPNAGCSHIKYRQTFAGHAVWETL